MASSSSPVKETHIAQCGSGINVANFVSSKLRRDGNRSNYESWKEQMLCLLESQGLLEFIEAPPPSPKDGVGYVAWRRTDRLVKGWILGALSDETLQDFVAHMNSAKDVWLDLENAFCTDQSQPSSPPPSPAAPSPQHGSGINVADFVSMKLSRHSDWNSYKLWKERMLFLVQSQNLASFLDIGAHPPPNSDANYSAWRQSDGMVKGWILEALSDEVVENVVHLVSAKNVWQELENNFLTSKLTRQEETEWHEQLELYKVAMSGDWAKAETILKRNPDAIRARVDLTLQTPLHIAVASNKSVNLVEKLVEVSDDSTLSMTDFIGCNPLHTAAVTGNRRAAEILINKLPDLLYASVNSTYFPLHFAAGNCHRETLELLMHHTRDDLPINPFAGHSGLVLLHFLIGAGFLDMALDLVNKYPSLAQMGSVVHRSVVHRTALSALATTDTVFAGHAKPNFLESLVYSCIQLEMEYSPQVRSFDDIESQNVDQPPRWRKQIQILQCSLWEFISELETTTRKHLSHSDFVDANVGSAV